MGSVILFLLLVNFGLVLLKTILGFIGIRM